MGDMQFHHDIRPEAHDRPHREADEWVRSRSLQRDARSTRSARERLAAPSSRRMRVMAVASPMVALLALAVAGGFFR